MGDVQEISISDPQVVQRKDFIGYKYRVKNIKIESSVKQVENYSFEGFTKLETIYISENVESFSSSATLNCKNLNSITVSENSQYFCNDYDKNLYSKDKTVLIRVMPKKTNLLSPVVRNFTIPSSVSTIQQYAFANTELFGVDFERNSQISALGILSFSLSDLSFITIPSSVTTIQNQAFYKCRRLQNAIFEENKNTQKRICYESFSYTSISVFVFPNNCFVEDDVFSHCQSLTEISIQDSSTQISVNTFSGCLSITNISLNSDRYDYSYYHLFNKEKTILYYIVSQNTSDMNTINVYSNLKEFCNTAFLNQNYIPDTTFSHYKISNWIIYDLNSHTAVSCLGTSISISFEIDTVKIGKRCFMYKNILINRIPPNLSVIEYEAFFGCSINFNQTKSFATFPNSLKLVETSAFQDSHISNNINFNSTEELIIEESAFENANFYYVLNFNNVLTSLGKRCFFNSSIKYVYFHTSISLIDDLTFANSELVYFDIPYSLKKIGISAFENCYYLISLPFFANSVESFGAFSFQNCKNINSFYIGLNNRVKYIGPYAFNNITNLIVVKIGLTDKILTNETFYSPNLQSYRINDNNQYYSTENNCIYNKNKTVLLWSTPLIDKLIIKGETETISDYAFYNRTNLASIIYENDYSSLKFVGEFAFSYDKINSFQFYSNITILGNFSFYMCNFLKSIYIHENSNLEYIGDSCFYQNALTYMYIPEKCSYIGMFAFSGSINLSTVIFEANSQCRTLNSGLFLNCTKLQSISIPDNLEIIETLSFKDCSKLANIKLNKLPIVKIGDFAFMSCTSLQEIVIPSACQMIGLQAFSEAGIQKLEFEENSNLSIICDYSFGNTKLQRILIPSSCQIIKDNAFISCLSLLEIKFEKSSNITQISNTAFNDCGNLEIFMIPDSYNTLNEIIKCIPKSIKKIILPETKIKNIPEKIFKDFDSINTIEANENTYIEEIEPNAFRNMKSLKHVIFNCTVNLGDYAFENCSELSDVSIRKIENFGCGSFNHCSNLYSVSIFEFGGTIPNECFKCCEKLISFSSLVPIKHVGNYSFYGCSNIILNISSLITVKSFGFYGSHIKEFPKYIEYIGESAFCQCFINEINISFSNKLSLIECNAFVGAKGIKNVVYCGNRMFNKMYTVFDSHIKVFISNIYPSTQFFGLNVIKDNSIEVCYGSSITQVPNIYNCLRTVNLRRLRR